MTKLATNSINLIELTIGCLKEYLVGEEPSIAVQRELAEHIVERQKPRVTCRFLKVLSEDRNRICRNFSCFILPYCFQCGKRRSSIEKILLRLANDKDWRVRESITWTFYKLLKDDFETIYPLFVTWGSCSTEHVRRAIIIATMRMGKHREERYVEPLLDLVQIFLTDKSKLVQKAIIFTLGDGFLRYYPTYVFVRLKSWIKKSDRQVRWIVAMSFSMAEARRHAEECMEILKELACDGPKCLHNAIVRALTNLAQEYPETVKQELMTWDHEPRRTHIAQVMMKEIYERLKSRR